MKCPLDPEIDLIMAERQGIEIDYCPKCRGVWLDRGELDKMLERAADEPRLPHARQRPDPAGDYRPHKYGKRNSILSEIFDF